MRIKPEKWSHHHIHRLFHLSQLAAFAIIIAALISGSFSVWQESRADTIDQTGAVSLTANVQAVNPGPAMPPGSDQPAAYPQPQQPAPGNPYVTIAPWSDQPLSERSGDPIFPAHYVRFLGRSNIPNALIFLDISGPQALRSTAYLNGDGLWFWSAPAELPNGYYIVTVTSQSQAAGAIKASSHMKFFIEAETAGAGGAPTAGHPSAPLPAKKTNAIDVAVRIPEKFKTIRPGDEFIANLDFFQSVPPATNTETKVHYRIENSNHHSVMDDEEKLQIPGRLSLIKSFTTSASLWEGTYTLIVSVESGTIITAASDTFAVRGVPVLLVSSPTKIDYTTALLILLALVLLFAFIAYFEYRKVVFLTRLIKDTDLTH